MKPFFLFFFFCCTFGLQAQTNVNLTLQSQVSFNETLANICGYAADGKEYALLGASCGMIVMDVTDPANPVQIVQIPMVCNLWKEIKVYQNYAYVTTEGNGGALQIVDLTNLPGANLDYQTYTGDGAIAGQLTTVHALHIDTTAGFVYLTGTNIDCVILDLNNDPYNPTYAGTYANQYVHDAYVDNDTMFAAEIYGGKMRVLDVHDKMNIVELGVVSTPNNFTHNIWLTPEKHFALTTDETADSYLTAYDITDLSDLTEVDRIQSNPGTNSAVHNTHITGDYYAVTSWYNDGVTIVDCSRPHNLVQVGNYDAGPGAGAGFDGTWGVYPFLPSGTMILSNIDEGLTVLAPNYQRACFFEGTVVDSVTLAPIAGANVIIMFGEAQGTDLSAVDGAFACGQLQSGIFNIFVEKTGYLPYNATITLVNGEVVELLVKLVQDIAYSMSGIYTCIDNIPIVDAKIRIYHETSAGLESTYLDTDANGTYTNIGFPGTYVAYASKWGRGVSIDEIALPFSSTFEHYAPGGFGGCTMIEDLFETNLGWTMGGTSPTGMWVRTEPLETTNGPNTSNPGADADDFGKDCFFTGNDASSAGADDVDDGLVWLQSPSLTIFDPFLPALVDETQHYYIDFDYWFYNGGGQGGAPNDYFKAYLVLDDEDDISEPCDTIQLLLQNTFTDGWQHASIDLTNYSPFYDGLSCVAQEGVYSLPIKYIMFVTEDIAPGHLVEAGVDNVKITYSLITSTADLLPNQISLQPNPTVDLSLLTWTAKEAGVLSVTDMSGRLLLEQSIATGAGSISIGANWPAGVYIVHMTGATPLRLVRL
jgi:choice-of-anchor B domain-containing protein